MRTVYGFPELVSRYWQNGVDFYVLSNEDIGFIANLVTGTNDVYNFAVPYPATVDLSDETIVVYAIEFILQRSHQLTAAISAQSLIAFLSYLDKDFALTFRGDGADTEDEALKSKFARNIFFGQQKLNITATASVEGVERNGDGVVDAIYFPPQPLDLVYPLFIDFVNQATSITLATNAATDANFTIFEALNIVVWFKKRRLTSSEKSARNVSQRFAMLDA